MYHKKFVSAISLLIILLFGFSFPSDARIAAPEEQTYSPVVLTPISTKTTAIKVYVYENTTLYIKKGSRILAKKNYKTEGIKTIHLKTQKKNDKLKFYLINRKNGLRGEIITKKVAAKKVKVKAVRFQAKEKEGWINVKGNIGDTIYIRSIENGERGGWIKMGTILYKNKKEFIPPLVTYFNPKKCYYQVRLKKLNGSFSKIIKVNVPKHPIYEDI